MKKLNLLLALLCISYITNAQFSYNSRDVEKLRKGKIKVEIDASIQLPTNFNFLNIDINKTKSNNSEIDENELIEELEILDSYIDKTEIKYNSIKHKLSKGKKFDDLNEKEKSIYLLHTKRELITEIDYDYKTNFRTAKSITSQVLSGISMVSNSLSDKNSGVIEMGAKINNTRISLPTKFKYNVVENNGKIEVTRYQRDRYLYFDFISRGLLSLDSLQNTMSEYVNSTQGSPLVFRIKLQQRLTPSYLDPTVTKRKEPVFFLNFDFDGRLVPVTSSTKIEEAGGSIHIMPSLIAVFPSGEINSEEQEDNFIVQLTFNGAYLSNNLKTAMTPSSGENPFWGNVALSSELRAGNYSETNPMRNWSIFAKYTWQKIVGSQFTFGFAFAPQGSKQKTEK